VSLQILVTGANGKTGRAIVDALLARGARVRGLVRKTEQAGRIEALGADAALGDLEDPASLLAAAAGCDTVLHIGPPMHPREIEMTEAVLDAAFKGGVGHFIYYSVMHPLRQDVQHHRLKLLAEAHVVEGPIPYTILQPIRYMQHLEPILGQVREQGVHAMPFNTRVRFNVVDLLDLAEAAAIVATEPGHRHATYELAGPEALSQDDMAAILTEALGRPVAARQISPEQLRANAASKGIDPGRIERMLVMNAHYDRHGFLGNPNILSWLIGRPPTRYRDYVRRLTGTTGNAIAPKGSA
jgi:uncharacterized protein YbjT (DUF2867 family)